MSKAKQEAGKVYFITMDLTKGYYCVNSCSKYRHKSFTGNRRFKNKKDAEKFLSCLVEAQKLNKN